jgi:hypothetical protein
MARTMTTPKAEDMQDDPTRLDAEGEFHGYVKDVRSDMDRYKDTAIEGYSVILQVLEGEQAGKSIGVCLRDGQPTHKDGGEFCAKVQSAFCVATNVLTPAQLDGGQVSYDEQNALNHQLCFKIKKGKPQSDGKQYLDLDGLHIFHVDDPRCAEYKKNAAAIQQIPPTFRKTPDFFEPLLPKKKGTASPEKKPEPPTFDTGGL